MKTLKRNTWYLISTSEGGGLMQQTHAMKVPTGVIVRDVTLVQGPNNVAQSTVLVEGAGICNSENPGFYEICMGSQNEASL